MWKDLEEAYNQEWINSNWEEEQEALSSIVVYGGLKFVDQIYWYI